MKQFRHSHEFKPPSFQGGNDDVERLHRRVQAVVHQNDVAVSHLRQNPRRDLLGGEPLLIQAVHVPHHQLISGRNMKPRSQIGIRAAGRAKKSGVMARHRADERPRPIQLLAHTLVGYAANIRMVPRVIGDLMSFAHERLQNFWHFFGDASDDEKGAGHMITAEHVAEFHGRNRMRPVIKSQRHPLRGGPLAPRKRSHGRRDDHNENNEQRRQKRLFHVAKCIKTRFFFSLETPRPRATLIST